MCKFLTFALILSLSFLNPTPPILLLYIHFMVGFVIIMAYRNNSGPSPSCFLRNLVSKIIPFFTSFKPACFFHIKNKGEEQYLKRLLAATVLKSCLCLWSSSPQCPPTPRHILKACTWLLSALCCTVWDLFLWLCGFSGCGGDGLSSAGSKLALEHTGSVTAVHRLSCPRMWDLGSAPGLDSHTTLHSISRFSTSELWNPSIMTF